jgi:hypothetical protein
MKRFHSNTNDDQEYDSLFHFCATQVNSSQFFR